MIDYHLWEIYFSKLVEMRCKFLDKWQIENINIHNNNNNNNNKYA